MASQQDVYSHLQPIFDEVFGGRVAVTPGLTARDVKEWDSLNQVRLVMAVEDRFGIQFSMSQVAVIDSVDDLKSLVERALEATK